MLGKGWRGPKVACVSCKQPSDRAEDWLTFLSGSPACASHPASTPLSRSATSLFGESDSNGLLGRANPVLAFAHVMDFFANEFSRLSARGFAFASVFLSPFNRFFFRHSAS